MSRNPNGKKKIALNVYLLKQNPAANSNGMWTSDEFLARPLGKTGKPERIKTDTHTLNSGNQSGLLYIRKPVLETEPEWLGFVQTGLTDPAPLAKLKNKSVSALLIVEQDSRQFAIAFGHGRFMIESRLIEDRFGIREFVLARVGR